MGEKRQDKGLYTGPVTRSLLSQTLLNKNLRSSTTFSTHAYQNAICPKFNGSFIFSSVSSLCINTDQKCLYGRNEQFAVSTNNLNLNL